MGRMFRRHRPTGGEKGRQHQQLGRAVAEARDGGMRQPAGQRVAGQMEERFQQECAGVDQQQQHDRIEKAVLGLPRGDS